jgi:hypothetical protein
MKFKELVGLTHEQASHLDPICWPLGLGKLPYMAFRGHFYCKQENLDV